MSVFYYLRTREVETVYRFQFSHIRNLIHKTYYIETRHVDICEGLSGAIG